MPALKQIQYCVSLNLILDTQEHCDCIQALSGLKTDPGTTNSSVVIVVEVVVVQHLTWKSDAPCTGEVLRGYGGRASRCVSMAKPKPPHLSDDLESKEGHAHYFCAGGGE